MQFFKYNQQAGQNPALSFLRDLYGRTLQIPFLILALTLFMGVVPNVAFAEGGGILSLGVDDETWTACDRSYYDAMYDVLKKAHESANGATTCFIMQGINARQWADNYDFQQLEIELQLARTIKANEDAILFLEVAKTAINAWKLATLSKSVAKEFDEFFDWESPLVGAGVAATRSSDKLKEWFGQTIWDVSFSVMDRFGISPKKLMSEYAQAIIVKALGKDGNRAEVIAFAEGLTKKVEQTYELIRKQQKGKRIDGGKAFIDLLLSVATGYVDGLIVERQLRIASLYDEKAKIDDFEVEIQRELRFLTKGQAKAEALLTDIAATAGRLSVLAEECKRAIQDACNKAYRDALEKANEEFDKALKPLMDKLKKKSDEAKKAADKANELRKKAQDLLKQKEKLETDNRELINDFINTQREYAAQEATVAAFKELARQLSQGYNPQRDIEEDSELGMHRSEWMGGEDAPPKPRRLDLGPITDAVFEAMGKAKDLKKKLSDLEPEAGPIMNKIAAINATLKKVLPDYDNAVDKADALEAEVNALKEELEPKREVVGKERERAFNEANEALNACMEASRRGNSERELSIQTSGHSGSRCESLMKQGKELNDAVISKLARRRVEIECEAEIEIIKPRTGCNFYDTLQPDCNDQDSLE